jgi:hypothetical protein
MKLILRDYLLSLKEDGELDAFITRLIRELDLIPITTPQRGRQYGVDIAAVGPDFEDPQQKQTLFLFVVKQGNITRANWDAAETGVRPTLNDILDTYLVTHMPVDYKDYPVKIILTTNGEIKSNAYTSWVNFTNQNTKNGITFQFWGTDKLADLSEKVQFSESLFPESVYALMRKTLVLLDANEYDYHHFYQLVNEILSHKITGKNENLKKIRLINTCYAIITNWSVNENNTKPAVIIGERVTLLLWEWLIKSSSIHEEPDIMLEYIHLVNQKVSIDKIYFERVKDSFLVENGLAYVHSMDHTLYALTCYEQIGIIASIGFTRLWRADLFSNNTAVIEQAQYDFYEAQIIAQYLAHLIHNNSGSLYPKFDEHCIEINLALMFLWTMERYEDAKHWLTQLIHYVYYNFRFKGFVPLFVTDYEELAEMEAVNNETLPKSSIFLTTLIDWSVIMKQVGLYEQLKQIITENFPDVNLQMWFPDRTTEEVFYQKNAMPTGNTKVSIAQHKRILDYEMEMAEENTLFPNEDFMSYLKEGFYFLGPLAFRHYRTYVFPNYYRRLLKTNFCFNKAEGLGQ